MVERGDGVELSMAISNRISHLCEDNGLSVNKLAVICGLRQSTISNILNGNSKNPTIASLKKICEGFNISLSEFFDDPIFDMIRNQGV